MCSVLCVAGQGCVLNKIYVVSSLKDHNLAVFTTASAVQFVVYNCKYFFYISSIYLLQYYLFCKKALNLKFSFTLNDLGNLSSSVILLA